MRLPLKSIEAMLISLRFFTHTPHMAAASNLCYSVGSLLYTVASSLSVSWTCTSICTTRMTKPCRYDLVSTVLLQILRTVWQGGRHRNMCE